MARHNRICVRGALHHCYQKTKDGFVIFYSASDYLVYFTLLCVIAPRYNVKIIAVALMPDHIHFSIIAPSWYELWRFMQTLQSMFAKENNITCHRKGPLFKSPFGSAPKTSDKKVRSNIAYVANNPVERYLATYAEKYRWTFLAYAESDNPFSRPIVKSKATKNLKKAIAIVDASHKVQLHLKYQTLSRLFGPLDYNESNQLTDYIISKYSIIDHQTAISYYGSYEKMITAIHSNTGDEHDIKENRAVQHDDVYSKMSKLLLQTYQLKDIHDILGYNADKKLELYRFLSQSTDTPSFQIAKYLRLQNPTASN